jgi:hypothetical protein
MSDAMLFALSVVFTSAPMTEPSDTKVAAPSKRITTI